MQCMYAMYTICIPILYCDVDKTCLGSQMPLVDGKSQWTPWLSPRQPAPRQRGGVASQPSFPFPCHKSTLVCMLCLLCRPILYCDVSMACLGFKSSCMQWVYVWRMQRYFRYSAIFQYMLHSLEWGGLHVKNRVNMAAYDDGDDDIYIFLMDSNNIWQKNRLPRGLGWDWYWAM